MLSCHDDTASGQKVVHVEYFPSVSHQSITLWGSSSWHYILYLEVKWLFVSVECTMLSNDDAMTKILPSELFRSMENTLYFKWIHSRSLTELDTYLACVFFLKFEHPPPTVHPLLCAEFRWWLYDEYVMTIIYICNTCAFTNKSHPIFMSLLYLIYERIVLIV